METYKILTINPGSTSTKIAVLLNEETQYAENVKHDIKELEKYNEVSEQFMYRRDTVLKELLKNNVDLRNLSAVVGRGGGLMAVEGGVYDVNDVLLEHATIGANGIQHPAQLGPMLARDFSETFDCPAFVVNPPDTDELQPVARMTGVKGIYRNVHLHALNQKETAIRHAKSINKKYEDCNFIVAHIGGGISIAAHKKGRMIDGNDIVGGEGPMAPTRCGDVPAMEMINYCFSGVTEKEAKQLCTRTGGFVSQLGTADALEVCERARAGEKMAELVWETMIYQIIKQIGAMATVLRGKIDGILLAGGIVHEQELIDKITEACQWIAPVTAYPGEFEMEAMASGAIRALNGAEEIKNYTGEPVWNKDSLEV